MHLPSVVLTRLDQPKPFDLSSTALESRSPTDVEVIFKLDWVDKRQISLSIISRFGIGALVPTLSQNGDQISHGQLVSLGDNAKAESYSSCSPRELPLAAPHFVQDIATFLHIH